MGSQSFPFQEVTAQQTTVERGTPLQPKQRTHCAHFPLPFFTQLKGPGEWSSRNKAGLFRCLLTVNIRNCSLKGTLRFIKIFTKLCSWVSFAHTRPPLTARHHPPPTRSRLRTCLLSERTALGCPQSPVWLKHLSFLSRSIFKPFIFVDDVKLVPKVQSPCFGGDDPARKEPRFQEKPDRRHELYKAHEWARAVIASDQVSLGAGPWRGAGSARKLPGER